MVFSRASLAKAAQAAFWIVLAAAAYIGAQYVVSVVVWLLLSVGVSWDTASTTSLLVYRLAIYLTTTGLLALAVWYRYRVLSLRDIALERLIRWKDIGFSALGAVAYVAFTVVSLTLASTLFSVDTAQNQNLGFTQLYGAELFAAFMVLVVLTPFFEEVLFRGFLYGRLRTLTKHWWIPALAVSLLFGVAHGQWNVGIDVFCLSMIACLLRELTGSIWAGILLHIAKNMIAFFAVFVFALGVAG